MEYVPTKRQDFPVIICRVDLDKGEAAVRGGKMDTAEMALVVKEAGYEVTEIESPEATDG